MKIKYLRPFRLYNPIGDALIRDEGTVEDMGKEDYAKWLIDNGFAEEVKESSWWKPKIGEDYYFLSNVGEVFAEPWLGSEVDEFRYSMGNCFKTKDAGTRWRDYLKAIATVRQDEGVLTPGQIYGLGEGSGQVYHIGHVGKENGEKLLGSCAMDLYGTWAPAGAILFDTEEHADASLNNHKEEWKIIASYDWSRE